MSETEQTEIPTAAFDTSTVTVAQTIQILAYGARASLDATQNNPQSAAMWFASAGLFVRSFFSVTPENAATAAIVLRAIADDIEGTATP